MSANQSERDTRSTSAPTRIAGSRLQNQGFRAAEKPRVVHVLLPFLRAEGWTAAG